MNRQKKLCQGWLASLEQQMFKENEFKQQVFSFRIRQVQFILEWLQELSQES